MSEPVSLPVGTLPTGEPVEVHDLVGRNLSVAVSTYGARIVGFRTPDRQGNVTDVVLGFDNLAGYLHDDSYHGATVGRFANRIAGGRFELDGEQHTVPPNEGANALHGGPQGFDRRLWSAEPLGGASPSVRLSRRSPDGEMGFPGTLDVRVTFTVDADDLVIDCEAVTDRATVVNLTQHAYFRLAGGGTVEDHVLQVDASGYLPVGEDLLPVGPVAPVDGTPFDFRSPVRIGDRIRQGHPQVVRARGIDHTYVLDDAPGSGTVRRAARLEHPGSGRVLEVWTDQPGLQVYTGNMLDGTTVGRGGLVHRQGDAVCLEPQHFPDSPNRPDYPSTVLRPGMTYRSREVLRTGVLDG
jgi:aldose 1-epimerase